MRWFFMSLLVLNVFVFVWFQQQAPLRAKEVVPLGPYRAEGQKIQLLREAPPRMPAVQATLSDEARCLFLGQFDQEASAKAVQQRLLSLNIEADVHAVETVSSRDFWVYLPPLSSRQAALRQLRELQSRSIDSYVITVGELANGISLGMFSQLASAEGIAARMLELGYEAGIRELPRTHRSYWVRVDADSAPLVDRALLSGMARDLTTLQHRESPCQGIATSD